MAEDLPLWAQELGGAGLEEQDEFDMLRMRSGRSDADAGVADFADNESDDEVPDWLQDVADDTDANTTTSSSGGSGVFNTFTAGQKLIIAVLVFLIVIVFVIGLVLLF